MDGLEDRPRAASLPVSLTVDDLLDLYLDGLDESIDAPRTVTYRWGNDDASPSRPAHLDDSTSTVFTFTLVEVDGGTELTVVERGFEVTSDPAFNLAEHGKGWNDELDKLVTLLESETA